MEYILLKCKFVLHWHSKVCIHESIHVLIFITDFGLSLGKTVYSILPQSTQLQNRHLALIRECLELVRYMLPAALEYPSGIEMVSVVYRPAREGRSCEHFGGYKTTN